jgi:hypothetical protein
MPSRVSLFSMGGGWEGGGKNERRRISLSFISNPTKCLVHVAPLNIYFGGLRLKTPSTPYYP